MDDSDPDAIRNTKFEHEHGSRRFGLRETAFTVLIVALGLLLFAGGSIRRAAEQIEPGTARDVAMALSEPAGWLADELPFNGWAEDATAWLSPDEDLGGGEGFVQAATQTGPAERPLVTPDSFAPGELGAQAAKLPLKTAARDRRLAGDAARRRAGAAPDGRQTCGSTATPTSAPASPRARCWTGRSSPRSRPKSSSPTRS